ncbi:unnamed protein product [Sphagnum balticum]
MQMDPRQAELAAASGRSFFAVGLIENRAKEVGLAAFDLRTARLHLSQYIETSRSYQNTVTLLEYFDPSDIVIPSNSVLARSGMTGVDCIVANFTTATKVPLPRSCFDDTKGALLVQSLASKDTNMTSLEASHKQYYLCLGAAAGLLKWIENEKGITIVNHSIQVTVNGSIDHMSIDGISVRDLELVEPISVSSGQQKKRGCLFAMLNTTKTVGGTRLLRANLLQPLKDIETINARLDFLDELTSEEPIFFGLSQLLQKFPKNIDQILCQFCIKESKASGSESTHEKRTRSSQAFVFNIIALKEALEHLSKLTEVLADAKCSLLVNIRQKVCMNPNYNLLLQRIKEVIDETVIDSRARFMSRTQQCFAIKPGTDGLLDVARQIFCATSEAIHELAKEYREQQNLPNLKMPFNDKRGYYISIPVKDLKGIVLPSFFIQVTKQKGTIYCSTAELTSLNSRNLEAAANCYMRTEHCLQELTNQIREELGLLTLLSESVSVLDMIVNSFAHLITIQPPDSYSRPEFTEDGPLAIEGGRHPVLETMLSVDFVPNNTFLSEAANMLIVTGPNMSGKSTYLRQVALITILAHIGCYVPAKFASLRVVDRIFTRIGTEDNLELNSSTFMTEMRETAYLLENLTPRSLVVIDELGRGTSTSDGFAIAWSCCEYLLSTSVYVIFATHVQKLTELSTMYPNVTTCHFAVDISRNRLDFKFELKEGCSNIPHYGLHLSEVAGLPASVVSNARLIASSVAAEEMAQHEDGHAKYHQLHREYRVAKKLCCMRYAKLSEEELCTELKKLKQSYLDDNSIDVYDEML